MSGHQYTADMVNNELNQFEEMHEAGIHAPPDFWTNRFWSVDPWQEGSLDWIMAQMNLTPDFSTAQEIHSSLEINTVISDFTGHGFNTIR